MSGRSGNPGPPTRPGFRTLALVGLSAILIGAAGGGSYVDGEDPDSGQPILAYQLEMVKTQRLVDASQRADRSRRPGPDPARSAPIRGAEELRPSPAPAPPEPEPVPAQAPRAAAPESTPAGPVPASCDGFSGNRATGCTLLLDAGYGIGQMSCLDNLWNRESGWNHRAQNPSSGAYGIPQALPGDKMASHGSDWRTNPATQIRWGLSYIDNRYGSPCGAWQFFQANNWY